MVGRNSSHSPARIDSPLNALNCSHLRLRFRSVYPVDVWMSEGFFTEQDLLDIDCYWLQFEPVKPTAHFSLVVLYVIIFTIGFFSNMLVIYILSTCRKLRTPANILLINLAVSDLSLMMMIPIFIYNSFMQGPAIGKIGCNVYGFLSGFGGTSSIMTLAAVAVDRFLVLSRPLDIDKKPTRSRAYAAVVLIWIYSALFAGMPFVGIGKYVPEGYLTSCSFDYLTDDVRTKVFIFVYFVGAWLYPLAMILFCYVAIIRAVYQIRLNVTADPERPTNNSANSKRYSQRGVNQPDLELTIAKIVMGLVGTWMIAWTPYSVVALLGISDYRTYVTPLSSMLPALFAKSAACVDPFIYALNHPKIRNEILYRLYKNFTPGRRGESQSCSARNLDWKTGRSMTFHRHLSGPLSRRAKGFPGTDALNMTISGESRTAQPLESCVTSSQLGHGTAIVFHLTDPSPSSACPRQAATCEPIELNYKPHSAKPCHSVKSLVKTEISSL